MTQPTTRCPTCARTTSPGARRCRHCRHCWHGTQSHRSPDSPTPGRWRRGPSRINPWKWVVLAFLLVVAGFASVTLPHLTKTSCGSQVKRCASYLQQIGLGITLYQESHGDRRPAYGRQHIFRILYTDGVLAEPSLFLCPMDRRHHPADPTAFPNAPSYESWSAGPLEDAGFGELLAEHDHRIPIAWDWTPAFHEGYRNVLFFDGHVEYLLEARFVEFVEWAQEHANLTR